MADNYSHDNSGNRCGEGAVALDPVLGSGQKIVAGGKNADAEIVVTPGTVYALTSLIGHHVFGIADTAEAANVVWAAPDGVTIIIRVPIGYTALHYQTPSNDRALYVRELKA